MTRPRFSVVIPAHDESAVIQRCLAFVPHLEPGEAEVIVVANGCRDDTAALARQVAGVTVRDLPEAGKVGALNAGDQQASAFPRVYLDADIEVDVDSLRCVVGQLEAAGAAVAAPRAVFVTGDRSRWVQLFFAAYERLPYLSQGMVGSGFYALNAAGRARFDLFPPVTGDDLFVQRLFSEQETLVVHNATFQVQAPRTLRSLVAVRTRIAHGNAELADVIDVEHSGRSTSSTVGSLVGLGRREPRMLPAIALYVAVTVVSRLAARRRSKSAHWQRDESTRR